MRTLLVAMVAVFVVGIFTGCATIFYPDRVNQPYDQRGPIDVGMLVLDILFFFPLSLIVDLLTGALWIPVHEGY